MKWCCSTRFHAICLTCRRCGHIWYFRYPTEKIITICNHDVSNDIFYLRKSHRYYWCRLYLFLTVILVYQNDTSIFKNKWTMNFKKNEQRAAPSHWKPVRVYNYMRVRTSKCNAGVTTHVFQICWGSLQHVPAHGLYTRTITWVTGVHVKKEIIWISYVDSGGPSEKN